MWGELECERGRWTKEWWEHKKSGMWGARLKPGTSHMPVQSFTPSASMPDVFTLYVYCYTLSFGRNQTHVLDRVSCATFGCNWFHADRCTKGRNACAMHVRHAKFEVVTGCRQDLGVFPTGPKDPTSCLWNFARWTCMACAASPFHCISAQPSIAPKHCRRCTIQKVVVWLWPKLLFSNTYLHVHLPW